MNRIEIIKKAVKKAHWKRQHEINKIIVDARRWTNSKDLAMVEKNNGEYSDTVIADLDDNSANHWQDGSEFAKVHYGEVAKTTNKEWDNG